MPSPRVSVICIFRDNLPFLAEAVDSVLAQDFTDFELLLADDGSTDGSSAIACRYAADHPDRVCYLEHAGHGHRGMSATRNLGLAAARGEFVTVIDGDDRWWPAKLREQVAILDDHPEVGMVCGAYRYWRSWAGGSDAVHLSGHLRDGVSRPPDTSLRNYPLGSVGHNPTAPMARRALVESVGGYVDAFGGLYEDQVFLAKMYLAAPVYFAARLWLDYRQHPASCTALASPSEYAATHRRFLDWLDAYVAAQQPPGRGRIERAIERAMWELDHPRAGRALDFIRWRLASLRRGAQKARGHIPSLDAAIARRR